MGELRTGARGQATTTESWEEVSPIGKVEIAEVFRNPSEHQMLGVVGWNQEVGRVAEKGGSLPRYLTDVLLQTEARTGIFMLNPQLQIGV